MGELKWFILLVQAGSEQKRSEELRVKGIESYCPVNKIVQRWKERGNTAYQPLFPGFVFVHLDVEGFGNLASRLSVRFAYWRAQPATVQVSEIEAIRNFLNQFSSVKVEKSQVNASNHVRTIYGPLVVNEGNRYEVTNTLVSITLPGMGYSLVARERKRPGRVWGSKKNPVPAIRIMARAGLQHVRKWI